ncbi:MAG: ATP-binding cassette domain-containing protein, partial [Hydrogenophaga sp.]|nr:ATP-binding cassette domain-containing protein [Hydrogenophaga sp.]
MNALAIDVRGLTKRYDGRAVVDDVTLQVGQGRICGFLGPNGSGKTTTIRMLCGLLRPDAGEGQCLGLDFRREAAAIKRQVGYMTQKFGLYDDLSIRENLDFVARLFELPQRRAAVDQALEPGSTRQWPPSSDTETASRAGATTSRALLRS